MTSPAIGSDTTLPDVRIGLATGTVLNRLGDVYGPPVNLASRLTTVARRNRVITDHVTAAVLSPEEYDTRALTARPLRGFGVVEPVSDQESLGFLACRRLDSDAVTRPNRAFVEHARVHAAVGRMRLDRETSESQVGERMANRAARIRWPRDLEDDLVTDRQPRPNLKRGHVEARGRQVLAGRARPDGMPLGGHAADRLDPQDGDRPMRPAVHRLAALPIAVDAVVGDARLLDRQLRHPAVGDVDLEDAAVVHVLTMLARARINRVVGFEAGGYHGDARSPSPTER